MKRALLVLAVGAALALPQPALAGQSFGSTATIHFTNEGSANVFYGVVRSRKAACIRHRDVKLVHSAQRNSGYSDFHTGIVTNNDGTWAWEAGKLLAGYYRAVAPRKDIATGVCSKARSAPVGIH